MAVTSGLFYRPNGSGYEAHGEAGDRAIDAEQNGRCRSYGTYAQRHYSIMRAKKGNVEAVFPLGSYGLRVTQDRESQCQKTRMHYEELVDRWRT